MTFDLVPYEITEPLLSGAYAEVYSGVKTDTNTPVVIKVARAEVLTDSSVTRPPYAAGGRSLSTGSTGTWQPTPNEVVSSEAALLRRVKHHLLPSLIDAGELRIDGSVRSYLVTRRIRGNTWRQALAHGGSISLRMVAQLVHSLTQLREVGLPFHGDVKPDNIITDRRGEVHVLDPSSQLAELDQHGLPLRLFTTEEYNPRLEASDIGSVGVVLLEALAGRHPCVPVDTSHAPRPLGPQLQLWLRAQETMGRGGQTRRFPWMVVPSDLDPSADRTAQAIALKCLGLELDQRGVLELTTPFEDLAELSKALWALIPPGEAIHNEARLARLGLLHLINDPEALREALDERIERSQQLRAEAQAEFDLFAAQRREEWERELAALPTFLTLRLSARSAYQMPQLPQTVLMVELGGALRPMGQIPPNGNAAYYYLRDQEPVAARRDLDLSSLHGIARRVIALSWPTPNVTGQHDTSDVSVELQLDVDIDGARGSLGVSVMAGAYRGPEAPELRSLLRTLVSTLDLPEHYVEELRAGAGPTEETGKRA